MAVRSTNANRPARQREPWMDDPNAIRDRRNTPPPPGPPGGGSVWDWSNQEWTDMPNLNPRRPWSRTNPDGTRTGNPNERIDHFPGSASGEWNPRLYQEDPSGNWVPKPTGRYGMPEDRNGKPIYTPDPTRYPEYFAPGSGRADTAEETRAYEEKKRQALAQDPEYVAAMQAAGQLSGPAALKARFAAEVAAKQRAQKQRYMTDYGMSEDTYDNRFNTSWPVPRSRNGQYWYRPPGAKGPNDPGVPGPTPPGVPPQAASQAFPPSQNPMMQGYLGGGAGVPQGPGGFGSAGGGNPYYRPGKPQPTPEQDAARRAMYDTPMGGWDLNNWLAGQSKSGMGQSPMSGPAMSTGNPMGGGNYMDMNPNVAAGRAALGLGEYGRSPMGYGGYNPMMGGGGMGGMGFGGFGGFNPYSMLGGGMGMGYNPGAQFSPYRNMMMGGY